MREPLRWCLQAGERAAVEVVTARIRAACRGPSLDAWQPPAWLLPHQVDAARRIAGSLGTFGGALLADAVGLGKTFVALSVATRYREAAVIAPGSLTSQWRRAAEQVGVHLTVTSDSVLSRGQPAPTGALLIVDEAHRYRHVDTRRHRALAVRSGSGDLLLVTATPVVSRSSELVSLLSLFLPDNAFAFLGVPSLERAAAARQYPQIARAAWAVTVARSAEALSLGDSIPGLSDSPVVSPSPVPRDILGDVLSRLRELTFPTFRDRNAAALLLMHLKYRLASSTAAFVETVDRHLAYLRRAIATAATGERLTRGDARSLFGEDDPDQLSLELKLGRGSQTVDAAEMELEVTRLLDIRDLVRRPASDPKGEVLGRMLGQRSGGKTIVFTSAVATAKALARGLGWRRVAVVTGRGAWIASGAIPVEEALRLFAPLAQGGPVPDPVTTVAILIATDLASEGLNLQDADAVVHYDLPWTPLRLAQRIGRAARLGSTHKNVAVWWFAPPPVLDEGLGLSRRIEEKLGHQVRMGVPVSSKVGRASITGTTFANRERYVRLGLPAGGIPVHCVVEGPEAALFAVRWLRGDVSVPELLVFEHGNWVFDETRSGHLMDALIGGLESAGPLPRRNLAALRHLVRNRFASGEGGAIDERSRRLRRLVLRLGSKAARRRDQARLAILDRALSAVIAGVPSGRLQSLELALRGGATRASLNNWLASLMSRPDRPISVILEAAVFGSGASPLSSEESE